MRERIQKDLIDIIDDTEMLYTISSSERLTGGGVVVNKETNCFEGEEKQFKIILVTRRSSSTEFDQIKIIILGNSKNKSELSQNNAELCHNNSTPCDNSIVKKSNNTVYKPSLEQLELEESGWYWPGVDVKTSTLLLVSQAVGTFLVRDSSDPRYQYTLSVQTDRGPTSVRIAYDKQNKMYSLDKNDKRLELPEYKTIVALVQAYCDNNLRNINKQIWVDRWSGLRHSVVDLKQPLRKDVCSLKHLCRLSVNKFSLESKSLPVSLATYVKEYPYCL